MSPPAEEIARTVGVAQTPQQILAASAEVTRRLLGADSTFVAVADDNGRYRMEITDGIRIAPVFREIVVRDRLGLGGQVLVRRQPLAVADYAVDTSISQDFVPIVSGVEDLHGVACVPIQGPDRVQALLYSGLRSVGRPADRATGTLALVAAYAELAIHQAAVREQEIELAMLRERQQLATQLHDSVAQLLFAIGVSAHYARRHRDPAALVAALEEIESTAADARTELRTTLHELSRQPEGLAFEARLAGEVRLFERISGCRVRITHRGDRRELPSPVEDLMVDTTMEGLRNAVKYGRSDLAVVHLAYRADSVVLVLQSGAGPALPPAGDDAPTGTGAGLAMLRTRAASLRGNLELTTGPGGGKILRLELPTRARGIWTPR